MRGISWMTTFNESDGRSPLLFDKPSTSPSVRAGGDSPEEDIAEKQAREAIPKEGLVCLKSKEGGAQSLEAGTGGSQTNVVVGDSEDEDREATREKKGGSYTCRSKREPAPEICNQSISETQTEAQELNSQELQLSNNRAWI
ncbi:hypothetical protein NW754_010076 [Fusarium falciforme]|nr:hypothetical protein NW754_010076 [Fusarium falciforme]